MSAEKVTRVSWSPAVAMEAFAEWDSCTRNGLTVAGNTGRFIGMVKAIDNAGESRRLFREDTQAKTWRASTWGADIGTDADRPHLVSVDDPWQAVALAGQAAGLKEPLGGFGFRSRGAFGCVSHMCECQRQEPRPFGPYSFDCPAWIILVELSGGADIPMWDERAKWHALWLGHRAKELAEFGEFNPEGLAALARDAQRAYETTKKLKAVQETKA